MSHDDTDEMDLDSFLGHKTGFGGGGKQLKKWKDRKAERGTPANAIDVLLHTKAGFSAVWVHQLPMLVTLEDKTTKKQTVRVFGRDHVCHEDEDTCRKHKGIYRGYDDNPVPETCGICKLGLWLYDRVQDGTISWVEPVFRFEGDDPKETKVIHAGGFYNAFGDRNLTDRQKAELKDAKIRLTEAWQENCLVGAKYIFSVAEYHHPENGVQLAVESSLLGDKVKAEIKKRIESEGTEEGNPLRNPYVLRWSYHADEKEFGKRYEATGISSRKMPISPKLMDLITGTKPPDKSHLTTRHNAKTVRSMLERHALIDIPWDDIFGTAERAAPAERPQEVRGNDRARNGVAAPPPVEEPKMFACDECGKAMRADAPTCPHCGFEYEVEAAPTPPEPALPKRSTAGKAAAAPPAKPTGKRAPEPEPNAEDDLPF